MTAASTATLEKHLKNVVGVHTTWTTSAATLINLFQIHTLVVHRFFLLVAQNCVALSNLLEHDLSLLHFFLTAGRMLVGMPHDSHLLVSLLDLILTSSLVHIQDLVVVLALGLLELDLSMLELFSKARGLRADLLDFTVLVDSLVVLLLGEEDVTFLEVGFDVLLVHGNGSVKSFKCFIILGDLGQGTSFVEKDGHVKSIVQVVEFQTLLIQGQCLLDVALPETVSCVILRLLGFRHVFPELHILRRVGVD